MGMPQLQVKAMSQGTFLKGQVTQKGIILKQTVKLLTFTLKVLCTLLHNLQKRKMNFSLKILNILKLFTSLSIQEWHSCLLFSFTIFQFTVFVDIQFKILIIVNIFFISAGGSHKYVTLKNFTQGILLRVCTKRPNIYLIVVIKKSQK